MSKLVKPVLKNASSLPIFELLKILFDGNDYDIDYRKDGKIHGIHTTKHRARILRYLGITSCFLDSTKIYLKCEICCANTKNISQIHVYRSIQELVMHIVRDHKNQSALHILLSVLKKAEILSIQLQLGDLLE